MKTMKKFAALLLVVVLMAAMLVVPANAAGTGSITITNALDDVDYTLYKVMDLSNSGDAFSYTVNNDWTDFFATTDATAYVNVDGVYVSGLETSEAAAFAAAVEAYADEKDISGTTITAKSGTVKFENLEDGYYVVGTSLTNQAAFGTSVPVKVDGVIKYDVGVNEKNALPTIDKTSTGSAGVGDTVKYTITIEVEGNVDAHYIVVDNMSDGKLEYVANSITVTGIDVGKVTVDYPFDNGTTTKAMKLTLDKDALNALAAGGKVTITYDAVVVEAGEIKNKVELNGSTGTPGDDDSETTSYNYNIDITKENESATVLEGAKFVLTAADGKYAKHDESGKFTGWMTATEAKPDTEYVDAVIWTSDAGGKIAINGVPAGTYTLKEIEAPEGYKLAADEPITITDSVNNETNEAKPDGKIDGDSDNTLEVTVVNKTGGQFPETGGVGTTIFYCLGGILVLAAIVFLVTKRRVAED